VETWGGEWLRDFKNKSTGSMKRYGGPEYVACPGPGGEPEGDLRVREPEVLPGSSREPEIGRRDVENRSLVAKPSITPSPYDGKTSWNDYQVQFEMIAELNGWNRSMMSPRVCQGVHRTCWLIWMQKSRRNY